jgi:uncharacterized membrane protein
MGSLCVIRDDDERHWRRRPDRPNVARMTDRLIRYSGIGAAVGAALGLLFGTMLDQLVLGVILGAVVGGLGGMAADRSRRA